MAGMLWHGMERFTASARPTVEECLRSVRETDLLVGIIAWRYGWEPEGEEKSITEMEEEIASYCRKAASDFALSKIPIRFPRKSTCRRARGYSDLLSKALTDKPPSPP